MRAALLSACLLLSVTRSDASGQIDDLESKVEQAKSRAREEFNLGMEVLYGMYRSRMADLIENATRIEVYLLDFSMGDEKRDKPALQKFPIAPYKKETAILASHTCTNEEREDLIRSLCTALKGAPSKGGVGCHFPIHGVRVWIGYELVFETSICWHCSNFQMDYGRGAGWENFTSSFRDLEPVLMRLMPIPKDEMKRFKKQLGEGEEPK